MSKSAKGGDQRNAIIDRYFQKGSGIRPHRTDLKPRPENSDISILHVDLSNAFKDYCQRLSASSIDDIRDEDLKEFTDKMTQFAGEYFKEGASDKIGKKRMDKFNAALEGAIYAIRMMDGIDRRSSQTAPLRDPDSHFANRFTEIGGGVGYGPAIATGGAGEDEGHIYGAAVASSAAAEYMNANTGGYMDVSATVGGATTDGATNTTTDGGYMEVSGGGEPSPGSSLSEAGAEAAANTKGKDGADNAGR